MFRFMIEFEIGKKKTSFKHDAKKQKERIRKAGNLINKKLKSDTYRCKAKIKMLSEKAKSNILKTQEVMEWVEEAEGQEKNSGEEEISSAKVIRPLDPLSIPKYMNQLVKPPVYKPYVMKYNEMKNGRCYRGIKHFYRIDIGETYEQMLPPGFPRTKVYGYGGLVVNPRTGRTRYMISSPGPTFEARRGIPIEVKWVNKLRGKHMFAVDPTLHWANPNNMPMHPPMPWPAYPPGFKEAQGPIPVVSHLHGGEVDSYSDGHPEAWFTYNKKYGPAYKPSDCIYPNRQETATLWYHDHTLGMTRLNVYAGLAGFYILREWKKSRNYYETLEAKVNLPSGKYDIPLLIQDRLFNTDGSLRFNDAGLNPQVHPYWVPGIIGDIIVVNGKAWPNMYADRCVYRFRLLNGSNTRFYHLKFSNGMKFTQIGSDGGYLKHPVVLSSLLLSPGERADILVDFSKIIPGTKLQVLNDANAPFPFGGPPHPDTVGQIMQFTITYRKPRLKPVVLPETLNHIERLVPDRPDRIVTLNDEDGPGGPLQMLLNGQKWSGDLTENPEVGSTQDWCIVNMTGGAHPVHLHLIQFQLISRQNYNVEKYKKKWEEMNGPLPLKNPTEIIPIEVYLTGEPLPPKLNETGWKDTIVTNPGQITRIRVRIAPVEIPENKVKPGDNYFPFDPSKGPGYVWHCHLLDHEDNEMMRPMKIKL